MTAAGQIKTSLATRLPMQWCGKLLLSLKCIIHLKGIILPGKIFTQMGTLPPCRTFSTSLYRSYITKKRSTSNKTFEQKMFEI
jgi:hypothetical protein